MMSQLSSITVCIFKSVHPLKAMELVKCHLLVKRICPVIGIEQVNTLSTHTGSIGDIYLVTPKQLHACSPLINLIKLWHLDVVWMLELGWTSWCRHGSFWLSTFHMSVVLVACFWIFKVPLRVTSNWWVCHVHVWRRQWWTQRHWHLWVQCSWVYTEKRLGKLLVVELIWN